MMLSGGVVVLCSCTAVCEMEGRSKAHACTKVSEILAVLLCHPVALGIETQIQLAGLDEEQNAP